MYLSRIYYFLTCFGLIITYLTIEFHQNIIIMLKWTIIFLVIALIAALFGFGGIAAGAAEIAKILFFVFLVLFIISLIAGAVRR